MIFKLLIFVLVLFFQPAYAVDSFSFLAFGDNQGWNTTYKLLLDKASKEPNVAFAVHVGDFVPYGKDEEYRDYLTLIKKYPTLKIYHAMGNHDAVAGGWKRFAKYFGPSYYSFDYENAHFVILNNSFKEFFDEQQIDWLKKDLASTDKEFKFLFFHKPVFDASGLYEGHTMDSRQMSERMIEIFKRYKVDYVVCGHIHGFSTARRDGVNYVITGGGGGRLYLPPEFGGFYHYVRFDVFRDKIEIRCQRIYTSTAPIPTGQKHPKRSFSTPKTPA